MGILNFIKGLIGLIMPLFSVEFFINQLTSEFLAQQRKKMTFQKYLKWLNYKYFYLRAIVSEREEKGILLGQSWIDKIKLVEEEIIETAKIIGKPPFQEGETRLSEKIEQNYPKTQ